MHNGQNFSSNCKILQKQHASFPCRFPCIHVFPCIPCLLFWQSLELQSWSRSGTASPWPAWRWGAAIPSASFSQSNMLMSRINCRFVIFHTFYLSSYVVPRIVAALTKWVCGDFFYKAGSWLIKLFPCLTHELSCVYSYTDIQINVMTWASGHHSAHTAYLGYKFCIAALLARDCRSFTDLCGWS